MDVEKKIEPTIVVQQTTPPAYHGPQSSWKTSSNVRLLIISVSAILIVGLVVTGFTLGFKHHSDSTEKALSHKTTVVDKDMEETIETDDGGLTKLYHVNTPQGSYDVLYDYNRNLRVVKHSNSYCMVTPMDSSEVDPQTAFEKNLASTGGKNHLFTRDTVPVRDTSFLGQKGQDLCEGVLVYWATPTCLDDEKEITTRPANTTMADTGRHKRQLQLVFGPCNFCCISGCGGQVCTESLCIIMVVTFFENFTLCEWFIVPGPC